MIEIHGHQVGTHGDYVIFMDDISHREPDNIKTDWYIIDSSGMAFKAPVGPYARTRDVRRWIDCGCPEGPMRYPEHMPAYRDYFNEDELLRLLVLEAEDGLAFTD